MYTVPMQWKITTRHMDWWLTPGTFTVPNVVINFSQRAFIYLFLLSKIFMQSHKPVCGYLQASLIIAMKPYTYSINRSVNIPIPENCYLFEP